MIRRITGSAALGKEQLDTAAVCKQCDHPAGSPESLERHSTRCANGGQRHYMHADLVALIVIILLLAGVPKSSIVLDKKGIGEASGHRHGPLHSLSQRHPGPDLLHSWLCCQDGRGSEVLQRQEVFTSGVQQVWGGSCLCPVCDGGWGTLGAHALALLKQLAEFAVSRGCFSSPDSRAPLTAPMQVSLWMQRWQHRLSTWLHVTLSQQLLRLYHP